MDSSARLKIKRAEKHIGDIEARVAALPDAYFVSIERDPKAGHQVLKYDLADRNVGIDLALMIGDAIHNLKCALDYAWSAAVGSYAPLLRKFAKFPVYPSRDALEAALHGREIHVLRPALYGLILSEIKPYHGGEDLLWAMHRLDIVDKHRLLIPVVNFAAVEGMELVDEQGRSFKNGTWATTERPPYYIHIEPGVHIQKQGKVAVEVIFDEGTPANGLEVTDTLKRSSRLVLQVVERLERVLG